MSKAFTREDDAAPERPVPQRSRAPSPPGVRRNLTPDGAQRFGDELRQLEEATRMTPASPEQERRIQELQSLLAGATVVAAPAPPHDQVRFGAFVRVAGLSETETTEFRIVGPDEIDADRNWIHSQAPLAKALVGARVGESLEVTLPGGRKRLQVLAIHYK